MVVLPQPDGPITETKSPLQISYVTSSTTLSGPSAVSNASETWSNLARTGMDEFKEKARFWELAIRLTTNEPKNRKTPRRMPAAPRLEPNTSRGASQARGTAGAPFCRSPIQRHRSGVGGSDQRPVTFLPQRFFLSVSWPHSATIRGTPGTIAACPPDCWIRVFQLRPGIWF